MREVGKHQHESLWIEALEAKFENKGDAWSTKQDFDRILEDFQVTLLQKLTANVPNNDRDYPMCQPWYSRESSSRHIQTRASS
jgi:hypothetical protein